MQTATKCAILYRDKWFLIVNKPEGFLSHPNPKGEARAGAPCAFEGEYDPEKRRFDTPEGPFWLIHRLDRDTSGALLAAADPDTSARMRELWDKGSIEKKYVALVGGQLPPQGKMKDCLFKQKESSRVRSVVTKGPSNAELLYTLKRYFRRANLSLAEVRLVTGRTHQIRVQFAHRKHPLGGDRVYGDFNMNRALRDQTALRRLFLHAATLGFRHPFTGKYVKADAPLPAELSACLSRLS